MFHSKPELEIYADDVKCSHGSSSTSLNKDELFYLMARGIPEVQAKRLIVQGFLSEVIEKISDENFKNYFLKKTEDMLS
jgi:Fe-S cluster assembly protein SufD